MENTIDSEVVYTEDSFSEPTPVLTNRKPLLIARWLIPLGILILTINNIADLIQNQIITGALSTILLLAGFIFIHKTKNSRIKFAATMGIIYTILNNNVLQHIVVYIPIYTIPIQTIGGLVVCWLTLWCIKSFLFMSMMGIFLNVEGIYKKGVYGLTVCMMAGFCVALIYMMGSLEYYTFDICNYIEMAINFSMIIYWWQLCSRSYPQEQSEKQPVGRLIFNRISIGFIIMIPFMIITYFALLNLFLD